MDSRIDEVNAKIEAALEAIKQEAERGYFVAPFPPHPKLPTDPTTHMTTSTVRFSSTSRLQQLGAMLFWLWVPALALWVLPSVYSHWRAADLPPMIYTTNSRGESTRLVDENGNTKVAFRSGEPITYHVVANKRSDCAPPHGSAIVEYRAWVVDDANNSGWVPIPYARKSQLAAGERAERVTTVPMPRLPPGNYLFQWAGEYTCAQNPPDRNPWRVFGPKLPFTIVSSKVGETSFGVNLPERNPATSRRSDSVSKKNIFDLPFARPAQAEEYVLIQP